MSVRVRPGRGAGHLRPQTTGTGEIWGKSAGMLLHSGNYCNHCTDQFHPASSVAADCLPLTVTLPEATMSDAGSQHHDRPHLPDTPSKPHRIAPLKGFLPLVEDTSLSTRGQHLPGLLASSSSPIGPSKSSSNVAAMKGWQARRRRSSLGDSDAPARRSTESDRPRLQAESPTHLNAQVDAEVQRRLSGVLGWGGGDEADERRMSMAANVLMTPQMRSQRLIGNSNPRYRWERYWRTEEELQHMPKKIRKSVSGTIPTSQGPMNADF